MKHNIPYLINLPPFLIKDLEEGETKGLNLVILIIKGKFLSFVINNTKQKLFCYIINFFFKKDGKIEYRDNFYIKETINGEKIYFPNKRILRIVKNLNSHLQRLYSSYCLDDIQFSSGDVIVDCGANVGELNLAFKFKGKDIEYIAFEPDYETFKCLQINSSRHKNSIHNVALSDTDGKTTLYLDSDGGNSSVVDFGSEQKVEVLSSRLDSMKIKNNIKLLKIEAEGFEPEVLIGGLNTLKSIEYISIDFGAERGISQEMTIVDCNKLLYNNNFELISFSEYRLIGLYRNSNIRN